MLSLFETWDMSNPGSPETASILPCAQRIRLPCQLQSIAVVADDGDMPSWEIRMVARMLDVERKYPEFALWDTVESVKDKDDLLQKINHVIAHGNVCIVESDIFSLDDEGLLLRFARVKVLSLGGTNV